MADVLVVLKVYPDSDEINLDNLYGDISNSLPKEYKIVKKETEPIAFGLKALILYIQMPEQMEGVQTI